MLDILMRAGCYVAVIVMGYALRKLNFFKEGDFNILSKIVLKITLPAAIVTNFIGKEIDISMLAVALIGLTGNLIYVLTGYLIFKREGREMQAFGMQNLSGYNIGNFIIPFVQSFRGSTGVIIASLFDVGNACLSLGGAFSLASLVKNNKGFSVVRILKTMIKSPAFDAYIIMTIICFLHIPVPDVVVTFAEVIGNANIFLSMLMLGVGFKISGDSRQIDKIIKVLSFRYGWAAIFALITYFILPFSLEIRQTAVIVLFSPIASAVPAFTGELGCDVGLSSAINSISVVCSVIIVMVLFTVML